MAEDSSASEAQAALQFVPKPLEDVHELAYLEYLLQLAFHTTELHVTKGLILAQPEDVESFNRKTVKHYRGSPLSVWVDMNRMDPPQSFDDCVRAGTMNVDLTRQLYEYGTISAPVGFQGNPTGSYRMLLFKLALGRTKAHTSEFGDQEAFLKRSIPAGYDSLELATSSDPAFYNALYRISSSQQVLLSAVVEFEFTPVKIEVPEPICEMCESTVAQWYCHSDKAHFCNSCDAKHHSATPIFSRHVRVSSSKSPVQFGVCESHPSEVIDAVCLKCNRALCSHCILFDTHSDPSFFDHPLMSTVDAYDSALNKSSESDMELNRHMEAITSRVRNRHELLSQLYANFNNVRQKIDSATSLLLDQLGSMRNRKLQYLAAIRREAELELLQMDWVEAFMSHLLLALNPAEFITNRKKHEILLTKLFGGECKVSVSNLPMWMMQRLILVGDTRLHRVPLEQDKVDIAGVPAGDAVEPTIAGDFTRTNLFEDIGNSLGHLGGERVDLSHKIDTILRNEPMELTQVPLDDQGNDLLDSNADSTTRSEFDMYNSGYANKSGHDPVLSVQAHVLEPVWALLSEESMSTLLHLIRAVRIPEKNHLIKHLATLANHFEEMDSLVTNACEFEMQSLCDNSLCMLMRSSSCLSELLCFIFLHDRYGCSDSLEWARLYCDGLHVFLNNSDLKRASEEAVSHVANKLVNSLDPATMPSTLRFVLYFLAELAGDKADSLCVDMLMAVLLSTHVARNMRGIPRESLTEVSFLMGRIGIACWDAVETNSLDFCLAAKLKLWMRGLLRRPRIRSSIHTRPTPVAAESLHYVIGTLVTLEREFNSGTSHLPVQQVNELTARYNFIPLFEITGRWAGDYRTTKHV